MFKVKTVGLAGGSCSGKTTLVSELARRFPNDISVMSFDSYFVGEQYTRGVEDWEDIFLYSHQAFAWDIACLKASKTIVEEQPNLARRLPGKLILPRRFVLAEGFPIFYSPWMRELFDLRLFIDIPEGEIIRRRLARADEGSPWDQLGYIQDKLIPGHRRLVVPQKRYAHHILDGMKSTSELVKEVLEILPYK